MDERLLVEAAQSDPARFGELYELHFERVYAYVIRRLRDRNAAEDVTSEVFHKALAHLRQYEWRGAPFAAWLYSIAAHAIADHFQKAARERPGPLPEVSQESTEELAHLFRLVDGLPDDQRRVVMERFVEQRSIREIAQDLGRSEGAVKQLQLRALQKLRAQMEGAHA
jgi:RNA polymerase sigma-70 factor (ECF subfamily)